MTTGAATVRTWPVDQRTLAIVEQAQRERFRITACAGCAGPVLWSKVQPLSRCLRCGHVETHERVALRERRMRCRRCHHLFHTVTRFLFCEPCREWRQKHPATEPAAPIPVCRVVGPENGADSLDFPGSDLDIEPPQEPPAQDEAGRPPKRTA